MGGGGGGGSVTTTHTQAPRKGVDRRQYGELASNGFQSQAEYDAFKEFQRTKKDTHGYGFRYNSNYGTYTLKDGVDGAAALTDFENWRAEREDIATFDAKKKRLTKAPEEFQSSKTADLSIPDQNVKDVDENGNPVVSTLSTYDESPSLASTSQPLGIY